MGLVFTTISEQGIDALLSYGHLILVLVGSMLFVALVVNPLITYIGIRKNPYPLVFKCLKTVESQHSSQEVLLQIFRST